MDKRKIKSRLTEKYISLKTLLETLFSWLLNSPPSRVSHWTIKEAKPAPVAYLSTCPEDEPFKFTFSFLRSGLPWVSGAVPHSWCALCSCYCCSCRNASAKEGVTSPGGTSEQGSTPPALSWAALVCPHDGGYSSLVVRHLWHPSQSELVWDSDM